MTIARRLLATAVAVLLTGAGGGISTQLEMNPDVPASIPISEGNTITISDAAGSAVMVLEVETMRGDPTESFEMEGITGQIRHEGATVDIQGAGGKWLAETNSVTFTAVSVASDLGWTLAAEDISYGIESHLISTDKAFVMRVRGLAVSGEGLVIDSAGLEGRIHTKGRIEAAAGFMEDIEALVDEVAGDEGGASEETAP